MCYDNIATIIFSHPPIGSVGLTEASAIKKWGSENVKTYKSTFVNMFYSPAKSDDKKLKSLFKVICHIEEDKTKRVVGCFAIGKGEDEMIMDMIERVIYYHLLLKLQRRKYILSLF